MSAPSAVVSCRHPLREFAVQRYNFFFEPANISYFSYLNILITTKKISTNHCAITPPLMIYESISVLSRINHGPFTSQLRILLQPIYTLYISRDFEW